MRLLAHAALVLLAFVLPARAFALERGLAETRVRGSALAAGIRTQAQVQLSPEVASENYDGLSLARIGAPPCSKGPSRPGAMQKEVQRGQAPKDIARVDKPHVPNQEPHVHFKDGTSLNQSGSVHDAHRGTPSPTRAALEWLRSHGWLP